MKPLREIILNAEAYHGTPGNPCDGKRAYDSAEEAHEAVRLTNRHDRGRPVEAYRCSTCQRWHVGGRR